MNGPDACHQASGNECLIIIACGHAIRQQANKAGLLNITSSSLTLLSDSSGWRITDIRHIARSWLLPAILNDNLQQQ
jgi:hypothetical protein